MKRITRISIYIAAVIFLLVLISCTKTSDKISVDEGKSFFSDFETDNDKVLLKYHVALDNEFGEEKNVTLSAKLPEDVNGGLLINEEVKALDEDGKEAVFVLSANETTEFDVVFVGEYGGKNQKHDRNLPEIKITIID